MMVKNGKGKIINIASDSGCAPLPDNASAYCASKAAVISMTRNTAKELGPLGVYCNAISPGAIGDTAMMDFFIEYTRGAGVDNCVNGAALRRLGKPVEIGNVALFLASGMSDFVTGENILVTGGDLMV
jgi:NAD(P)-dependent dehydrogenase (short-subunit alcohol dehydrogenase family)